MKCCIMLHIIWVLTVYKNTRLGVSRIQRINVKGKVRKALQKYSFRGFPEYKGLNETDEGCTTAEYWIVNYTPELKLITLQKYM